MGAPQGWEEVGQKDKATIKSFVRNHQPLCRPQVCLTVSQRRKGDHHHHHHHHHHHLTFQSGNCKRVSKRANPKNVGKGRQDVPSKNQYRKKRKDVSHNIHFLNLEPFVQLFQFRLHLTCYKHVTNTFPADNWQSIRFPLEKRSQHCFRPNLFSADFLIWKCSVGNQIIEKSESNVWLWATESATVSSVIRSESSLISLQISESVVHAYVGFQRYGANCFAAGWSDLRCIFSAARVCSGREGWGEER